MSISAAHPAGIASPPADIERVSGRSLPGLTMRSVTGAEWDLQIAGFDGAVQEQVYVFASARWQSARHEPVLFERDGEIVGGTLVMVQPLPLGLTSLAVCKWGPMLKENSRSDRPAIYAAMVDLLVEEYARRRAMMLSIMPHASLTNQNAEFEHLLARGFTAGPRFLFPDRYLVNLALDDAAMRRSFGQKWRYHLNKSEKAGLTIERAGPERLAEFDALYMAMTDRKKFPDTSAYSTLAALMAIADARLRPELFFVRHEGEVVAGAVIFKAGERAVYLYGATNDRALPLRAGYFMHWHIMRWLRDNTGARWYDLGGTDGFKGLHQFKKGMVGDAGTIQPVPAVANFAVHPLALVLGTFAYRARDAVQHARRHLERFRRDIAHRDLEVPEPGTGDR